ncbi:MAG: HlyD family secretion protein [Bacteroidales bacterium]|nr:HlyD family secretion protein [Bacteroidales bacterium]
MNRKNRTLLVNIVVVLLIGSGLVWIGSLFVHPGGRAWTNNAQVRRDIVSVTCRVQGFVERVACDDFQKVERGDTLVWIEDVHYRLQTAQAEAGYRDALAAKSAQGTSIRTTKNNLSVSDAELDEVRLQMAQAKREYDRNKTLLASEAVTRQQFEKSETQYLAWQAKHDRLLRQQQSTRLVQDEQSQRLDQNAAAVAVAEATLRQAQLNQAYTVVTAPCSGRAGRRMVKVGELVVPGRELLCVVSDSSCWVEANFRERQMKHVVVGATVDVKVDALGGQHFRGRVAAVADATGAQFSHVAQDNSTGNFVKVEQLIPVKVELPLSCNDTAALARLKSGMNVECKVVRS